MTKLIWIKFEMLYYKITIEVFDWGGGSLSIYFYTVE